MAAHTIRIEQHLDDVARRRGSYLAFFGGAPWKLWVFAATNVVVPVVAIIQVATGDSARAGLIGGAWLLCNRWVDPVWRLRMARLRRARGDRFGRPAVVELSSAGVDVQAADDGGQLPWSSFCVVADQGGLVALGIDPRRAITLAPSPPTEPEDVVAMAVANGVRPAQPNGALVFLAIGPW